MGWRPIVEGEEAARAARVVDELLAGCLREDADAISPAQASLLWAYAAAWQPNAAFEDARDRAVEQTAELDTQGVGLWGGLCGHGFVLAHLVDESCKETLASLDDALFEELKKPSWPGHFDLISGLVGVDVYLRERTYNSADASRIAELRHHVAKHLLDHIAGVDESACLTPARLLGGWQAAAYPNGKYDCGLAHGVPGVAATLAALSDEHDSAAEGARDAFAWVWQQRLPRSETNQGNAFPGMWAPNETPQPTRTAWCYGDIGIALASLRARHSFGEPTDAERAILLDVALRPASLTGVADTCLCHGSAGMVHLFNRAYQATHDPRLLAAARTWLSDVLADPIRGFSNPALPRSPGLLEGAAGVALALIASISADEPLWDRLLLIDLPVL